VLSAMMRSATKCTWQCRTRWGRIVMRIQISRTRFYVLRLSPHANLNRELKSRTGSKLHGPSRNARTRTHHSSKMMNIDMVPYPECHQNNDLGYRASFGRRHHVRMFPNAKEWTNGERGGVQGMMHARTSKANRYGTWPRPGEVR
jgi:hypothetical protein